MTSLPTPSPGIHAILYLAIGNRFYRRATRPQASPVVFGGDRGLPAFAEAPARQARIKRIETQKQKWKPRSGFFWKNLLVASRRTRCGEPAGKSDKPGETPGRRPTGRMPVLRLERHCGNPALGKHCPEPVPLFVVLIKNEISDEGQSMSTQVRTSKRTENPAAHEIVSRAEWLQCMTQRRSQATATC